MGRCLQGCAERRPKIQLTDQDVMAEVRVFPRHPRITWTVSEGAENVPPRRLQ